MKICLAAGAAGSAARFTANSSSSSCAPIAQHPHSLAGGLQWPGSRVIGEKYPGMQMVSFGPQIENPHSPHERVQISSVESFWKYLRGVLEHL